LIFNAKNYFKNGFGGLVHPKSNLSAVPRILPPKRNGNKLKGAVLLYLAKPISPLSGADQQITNKYLQTNY